MAIQVGSVEVDVIPNTQGIYQRLRSAMVPAATRAGEDAGSAAGRAFGPAMQAQVGDIGTRIGQQIGSQIAARITAEIRGALRDGVTQGGAAARPAATRQGEETGGAFARAMKTRLEAAFRNLPKIDIDANTSEADADLQALRVRMETLASKRIGVDIDTAAAKAELTDIEEQLRRLGASHPNATVRADTAAARAELAAVRAEIDRITATPGRVRLETDGTFGQRLRAAVQQAEASLPNINIDADTGPAQAEIASLRAQLTSLRDQRVGIDIDASAALARVTEIQARLQRLSASDADVAVRVDAAGAAAQLAAVQAMINRLDGQTARVSVDASGAMSAIIHLAVAIGGLAAIPAVPILAAGIGAIASSAVAAGAGVGALAAVAAPAILNIGGALQAQKAAQDAATNATYKGGQAASQGASKALQMAGAQQALASAHRNAARQIKQAEQGVGDAVRSAAEASSRAADQVKQAKQSLADAVQQAADRQRDAAERVAQAEQSLADAQRTARQAQQDLTRARKDAAAQLAEMGDRLANAQLSERDAALSVQEVTLRLAEVRKKGSKATLVEQQRAQLAYDQAVQRLKEQQSETKDLTAEKAAADKAGVEGSETVKAAQERVGAAERGAAEQQKALGKARTEAARQQVQSQRDIATAQEKVAESQRNVTRVQEDGARSVARAQDSLAAAQASAADSIASAQRQIASAQQSAASTTAGGINQAAVAQARFQALLAKLTPAARGTFNAFVDLRSAFGAWSRSLQPAVMPIFTRALDGIRRSLPGLTPFVLAAAKAIGGLQDRVSAGFKSPWWKAFKKELAGSVGPAITGLGVSFGRIFKGMAGIVQAFLPHMDSISKRMQAITGRFATWATNLKGSPQFEKFLAYAAQMSPVVSSALRDMLSAVLQVAKALTPAATILYLTLGAVARAIGSVARDLPWLIQLVYAVWIATKLWTLALLLFNVVVNANPLTLIIVGIVALVAAVIYAYKNFAWFRDLVNTVWAAIQTAASWAWNNVLKPVFDGIWGALQTVGRWATWLWQSILSPVFTFIATAAKVLLTALVVIVLLPIIAVIKAVGAIATWLWSNAIGPAFRAIGAVASWLWKNAIKPAFDGIGWVARWLYNNVIQPAFQQMGTTFKALGAIGTWLWRNVLKPAFEGIATVARWLWNNVMRPVFDFIGDKAKWLWDKALKPAFDWIKKGIKAVGDSFEDAKDFIAKAWNKVQDIAKKPVRFIIDKVYNNGIVPVWNKVATAFGAPEIKPMNLEGWATGGVLPGYTPGRDVHRFVSPTGGGLELSGGEAIMRPEFTRAVGSGFVSTMNKIASSRGATGVKAALAPALGGNPLPTQRFADGGIFGWIGRTAAGIGSSAWDAVKKGAGWLKDGLESSARAGVKYVVDPLLSKFPGADTDFGRMVRRIPTKIIDSLFGYTKEADTKGGGGLGGPRIQAALKWARTQNGLPYQWAGNGNPSWDCSGLMSAIESVIRSEKPHRRWATGAFSGKTAPGGWVLNGKSPFQIGITTAGVGHTAGTLGKVNVESRGGDGVVVGSRARGYNDKLFTHKYGFMPGKYDSGGYLQPGLNLAYNGTGRPEPVFTSRQASALTGMASTRAGIGDLSVSVYVGDREITDIARAEVHTANGELIQVLNARGGN